MSPYVYFKFVLSLVLVLVVASCNDTPLSSGGGDDEKGKALTEGGDDEGSDGKDGKDRDSDSSDKSNDDDINSDADIDVRGGSTDDGGDKSDAGLSGSDAGTSGRLSIDEKELCMQTQAGRIHAVLVFDSSGSQSSASLASMRRATAGLVEKVAASATKKNAPITSLSVVRFSSSAEIGSFGWVGTDSPDFVANITADISTATANDFGGTQYAPAFARVQTLFNQINTSADEKFHRNFVVFLTDGEPKDGLKAIPTIESLVSTKGVAVIAVGTGQEFTENDDSEQQVLQAHALPAVGTVAPDHKGQMLVAGDDAQLQAIFSSIIDKLLDNPCD